MEKSLINELLQSWVSPLNLETVSSVSNTLFIGSDFITKLYSFIQINSDLNHLIGNPFIYTVHGVCLCETVLDYDVKFVPLLNICITQQKDFESVLIFLLLLPPPLLL